MHSCKLCNVDFEHAPEDLILCKHKQGFVHLGCCITDCSWHGKPCENSLGFYNKL